MLKRTDFLTRLYGKPEGWKLAAYEREMGGYQVARRTVAKYRMRAGIPAAALR